jgi:hypothetical protein
MTKSPINHSNGEFDVTEESGVIVFHLPAGHGLHAAMEKSRERRAPVVKLWGDEEKALAEMPGPVSCLRHLTCVSREVHSAIG